MAVVEFGAAAVARGMQPPWGLAATVLLILVTHITTNVALRVVSDPFELLKKNCEDWVRSRSQR